MQNHYRIALKKDGEIYDLFIVGFDKEGGYFIQDICNKDGLYFITKIDINKQGFNKDGYQEITWDKSENHIVIKRKPKLMYHSSGKAQVSGLGIRSGFFKTTGWPKGVATESSYFGDGGPRFGFLCWGVKKISNHKNKENINRIVFDNVQFFINHRRPFPKNLKQGYIFEGFYLPKDAVPFIDISSNTLWFPHPKLGLILLKVIPPRPQDPGFIAISCQKAWHGFKTQYGFVYSGGVTRNNKNGEFSQINIIFPWTENPIEKKLNFRTRDLVISYIDKIIASAKNKLINFFKKIKLTSLKNKFLFSYVCLWILNTL